MSDVANIERTMTIALTVEDIARAFCELDDDAQAQFFVHVDRLFESWRGDGQWPVMQRHAIGRHLAECACSTSGAREWLRDVVQSMEMRP